MKLKVYHLFFLAVLVIATVWIVAFRGTASMRESEGPVFGTMYHIKYEASAPLDREIQSALAEVDASLSVFNKQSTISRINRGETDKADAMLVDVVTRAQRISEVTDGAFDITVMPLVNAWGFGFKNKTQVTEAQIDSMRAFVGFRHLLVDENRRQIKKDDPRVMLDCGAIAKGYGADRVAQVLSNAGVRNYMVEIGGEIVVKGRNPETGKPWNIGISKPIEGLKAGSEEVQVVLSLSDCGLATSGNYRNFYVEKGVKYAHTIDPKTGRPVQHSLLSATVRAADCATADAYATAFMVMGVERAKVLLEKNPKIKAYLIYADERGEMKVYSNL